MKKLLGIMVLGLFLQSCDFINPKTYLSCYRETKGWDKAFGMTPITIFAFDRNYLYEGWDPYEKKLRHKKEANIEKRYIESKGYSLNRETGKLRLKGHIGYVWDCKQISKSQLPIKSIKQKF